MSMHVSWIVMNMPSCGAVICCGRGCDVGVACGVLCVCDAAFVAADVYVAAAAAAGPLDTI